MNIILPNETLCQAYANVCMNMIDQRVMNIEQNRNLAKVRDTLLPKLLSGKLEVLCA